MNYTYFLRAVIDYIEQAELQLDGTELSEDMPAEEMPLLYAEALRLLAVVERRK
jgi:hypothetical protein